MSRGRKTVAFVGRPECGKSTQIKKLLDSIHEGKIIYDENYQKAWLDVPEISMDQWKSMTRGKYKVTDPDFVKFYEIASEKWKRGWQGVIVHEDAGTMLGSQKNDKLFKMLISLRHKATDLVLVFHSLMDTPPYVIRQLNEIILFKTGDNWTSARERFPDDKQEEIRQAFDQVNNSESQWAWKRIILRKTGTL